MPPVTPDELALWRRRLYLGQELDAATARRLMDELERLDARLEAARVEFATKAALALEKRLEDIAAYNHGGCPACHDAEARAFLARLKKIVLGAGTPRRRG